MPVGPFSFLQRERARPHHSRSSAGASLQPTLPDRFVELLRPGWSRIVRARRIAAGLLAVLAVILRQFVEPQFS